MIKIQVYLTFHSILLLSVSVEYLDVSLLDKNGDKNLYTQM